MFDGQVDLRKYTTLTVAIGSGTSDAADLDGRSAVGLVLPAAFEATTAKLEFLVSHDGQSYQLLRAEGGTIYAVTVAATNTNLRPYLDWTKLVAWRFVKVILASSGDAEVNQTAARSITLISAPVGL